MVIESIRRKCFRSGSRNKLLVLGIVVFTCFYFIHSFGNTTRIVTVYHRKPPEKFLVNSKQCQIPEYDVWDPQMMTLIKYEEYKPCQKGPPLTDVVYDSSDKKYKLRMIRETSNTCYYGDNTIEVNKRLPKEVYLESDSDFVLVKCYNAFQFVTYMNFHTLLPHKSEVASRSQKWKSKKRKPPSVLVFGIDTLSRLNFFRTMKRTSKTVLEDPNEWFPLEGYNKVGRNTFPNLMAMLKGWSESEVYRICDPVNKYLDEHCPLIWKDFQKNGYVTAYAEDFDSYSTFKFLTKGFKNPPTDYYFMPMFEKATTLEFSKCIGNKYEPEIVYEYAIDFAKRFKDTPYFGFFWTNDFSHHYVSEPSGIDEKVNDYIKELISGDTLDNTIVFLMSDHGVRFGDAREVPYIGKHEDFLPLMYIRLPKWMKKERPDIVKALKANKNTLTSHFDTFLTLRDILSMSSTEESSFENSSVGCPMCQSYFKKIEEQRSCTLAGIPPEYCACEEYSEACGVETSYKVANAVIEYLNNKISKHNKVSDILCRYVDIKSSPIVTLGGGNLFKINMYILPGGLIEGFVGKEFKEDKSYDLVVKNVQRIDAMGKNASEICPVEREIFEFCFCL